MAQISFIIEQKIQKYLFLKSHSIPHLRLACLSVWYNNISIVNLALYSMVMSSRLAYKYHYCAFGVEWPQICGTINAEQWSA